MAENQTKIQLSDTTEVICEMCANNTFYETLRMRKVSNTIINQETAVYIPIPVYSCIKCNHTNNEFIPVELSLPSIL